MEAHGKYPLYAPVESRADCREMIAYSVVGRHILLKGSFLSFTEGICFTPKCTTGKPNLPKHFKKKKKKHFPRSNRTWVHYIMKPTSIRMTVPFRHGRSSLDFKAKFSLTHWWWPSTSKCTAGKPAFSDDDHWLKWKVVEKRSFLWSKANAFKSPKSKSKLLSRKCAAGKRTYTMGFHRGISSVGVQSTLYLWPIPWVRAKHFKAIIIIFNRACGKVYLGTGRWHRCT